MSDAPSNSTPTPPGKVRLGDVLVDEGLLSKEQLKQALERQRETRQRLGEMLVEDGILSGAALVRTLGARLGVPGCQLRHGLMDPALLSLIGEEEAERLCAIPMFKVRDTLTVAMAEPQSLPDVDRLRQLTGCRIRPVLALEPNILEFVRKYASGDVDVDEFLTSLVDADVDVIERETVDEGPATDLDKMVEGSPVINLVNVALLTAIKDKASDIHIEPSKAGTRVRYRIDVGASHGVQPKHIVGAIANEAGLDGRHIGPIEIGDEYSVVGLPAGMPTELAAHLKRVRVCGRPLRLRALPPAGAAHARPEARPGPGRGDDRPGAHGAAKPRGKNKHKRGKVIIQAMNTAHPVLGEVIRNDFLTFFQRELQERHQFQYPPFARLIRITIKHKKPDILNQGGKILEKSLKSKLGEWVIGPAVPYVGRVRGYFLLDFLIKLPRDSQKIRFAKDSLLDAISALNTTEGYTTIRANVDVDPY